MKPITVLAAAAAFAFATPAIAADPPESIVSIYHVAPGHQEAFLQWLARQEAISASAGVPASQLYVHTDGDSWDYVVVAPVLTEAQDEAVAKATTAAGVNGMRGGLELRQHITGHTDTFTIGPVTAQAYLEMVKK
ncbi:hypothetical protein [Sphingomicrobium nitratireducens]|uniref:hypothetical protein n=1 Tax=Sphingomicrobium nitratireducens TaxID=2964666 RepID=UPI00223F5757|nr:hypothetical protein [Sphingomicrobium nitratireducens]